MWSLYRVGGFGLRDRVSDFVFTAKSSASETQRRTILGAICWNHSADFEMQKRNETEVMEND